MHKLLIGVGALLALTFATPAGALLAPPELIAPNSEVSMTSPDDDCCGSDEDSMVLGQTADFWDAVPTTGAVCQDDKCLIADAAHMLQLLDLQRKLESSILFQKVWYGDTITLAADPTTSFRLTATTQIDLFNRWSRFSYADLEPPAPMIASAIGN